MTNWRWKIQAVDLNQTLPDLIADPQYDGVFATFWWKSIPLGYQEIAVDRLPMPASQLANLAVQTITPIIGDRLLHHGFKAPLPKASVVSVTLDLPPDFAALQSLAQPLAQLEQQWQTQLTIAQEPVSVLICTRDRPEQLAQCLRSLQQLSPAPNEILVIDNAPSSDTTYLLMAQFPTVRYVLEPRPGLSVARNTGIHHANSEIIVFTDDDVEVHPDWLTRLRLGFCDPQVMVVTGLMLPAELETEAQISFHRGATGFNWECRSLVFDPAYFAAMQPYGVPVWYIGAGASMALRRKAVKMVGGFDERLGAGASGCSEDSEFWYRVLAAGYSCRYEPTAVIYHYHRREMSELKHQMYAYMRGHVAALLIQAFQHRHWGNLFRLGVILPDYFARLLVRGLISGFHGRYQTIFVEILGCISGLAFFSRNAMTPAFTPPKNRFSSKLTTDHHD
ncbi:glycosyltransferase [Pseudanabaena biceps]|nr:glycosyltransferase [Pseudanabaena biceps]